MSDPSRIADTAWIKPGKAAWDWWSGRQLPGATFKTGMNNDTMKAFIDLAGEYGFEYMLIDARWSGYSYDTTVDITRSIPEIDVPGHVAYGRERKVGVMLWLNWENVRDQIDVAFPLYEKWGVRGIKIDLIDRKDQEIVAFYERVLKTAAKCHLLVDFHGAYAPTGEERTWPNLLTREGVLGLEHYKWCDRITPRHNVTLPFTRMLLGPMDYTPGGFRNVTPETYASRYDLPFVMGTRAHQLAMFVVYDSPLQMVADTPSAYRGEPAADFLKVVPSTWDETRVLAGQIGEYVAIARRHGRDWFIGAMTDAPRKLELALPFLGAAAFEATVYADAPDSAAAPTHTAISRIHVAARENRPPLVLDLVRGGGAAVHLRAITDRSVPAK